MKWFQNSIRLLIAAGSIAGFAAGWALLAHAGKPVDAAPPPSDLAPVPQSLPDLAPSGPAPSLQPLPTLPSSLPPSNFSVRPRLRTRGS